MLGSKLYTSCIRFPPPSMHHPSGKISGIGSQCIRKLKRGIFGGQGRGILKVRKGGSPPYPGVTHTTNLGLHFEWYE